MSFHSWSPSAEILGCLLNGFFFPQVRHARHDIDPSEMVMDRFHAGHIFRGGDEGRGVLR